VEHSLLKKILNPLLQYFSNSSTTHENKTKKITTVEEGWIPGLE